MMMMPFVDVAVDATDRAEGLREMNDMRPFHRLFCVLATLSVTSVSAE